MNKMDNKFGALMKRARKEKRLTLAQLGEIIGYSAPYLSQIESGSKDSLTLAQDLIKKIANALDISFTDMLRMAGYSEAAQNMAVAEAIANAAKSDENVVRITPRNAHDLETLLLPIGKMGLIKLCGEPLSPEECERAFKMLMLMFPNRTPLFTNEQGGIV